MAKAVVVTAVLLGVLLLAGGASLYAYDRSRAELIADGTVVAGVDVGDMEPVEARAAVQRAVVTRLERPLLLKHDGTGFMLVSPERLDVDVDVEGMVAAAFERSREGNFLGRALRDLTGDDEKTRIPLDVSYSREAVAALVSRAEGDLNRRPREAKVVPSPTALATVQSRNGLAVRSRRLERLIVRSLVQPGAERTLEIPTRVLRPKMTTSALRSKYRFFITISRPQFQLRLFSRLELAKVYPISIGRIGFETPTGLYRIKNKAANPAWYVPNEPWAGKLAGKVIPPGPDNPIKARWMGIYDGAGIHGTNDTGSIGQPASHGCIRMRIPDVIRLYDRVPVDTPVYIG